MSRDTAPAVLPQAQPTGVTELTYQRPAIGIDIGGVSVIKWPLGVCVPLSAIQLPSKTGRCLATKAW